jgi:putative membrane protein
MGTIGPYPTNREAGGLTMKRRALAAVGLVAIAAAVVVPSLASGDTTPSYSGLDQSWLKTSIQGDLFEIRGGKIALRKSNRSDVRSFAKTLIADHGKSLQDATDVAHKLGIDVPSEPTDPQKWQLGVVSGLSGRNFVEGYSSLEVADHKLDIEEAQDEVDHGSNADVVKLAQDDLPVLQKHLGMAEAIEGSSDGGHHHHGHHRHRHRHH